MLAQTKFRNRQLLGDARLLPCPFCGSEDLLVYMNAPSSDCQPWPHVACLCCGTGQSTIEKWNRRAAIGGQVNVTEDYLTFLQEHHSFAATSIGLAKLALMRGDAEAALMALQKSTYELHGIEKRHPTVTSAEKAGRIALPANA